ncbi:MAG: hypothetical protein EBT57_10185, partial [Verrucomicrobia bacterium]|nr:hypothetical protein [Verrucomicrobiota bacterium]
SSPAPDLVNMAFPFKTVEKVLDPLETEAVAAVVTVQLPPLMAASTKSRVAVLRPDAPNERLEPEASVTAEAETVPPEKFNAVVPLIDTVPAVTPPESTDKLPPLAKPASRPLTHAAAAPPDCQLAVVPTAQLPLPPVQENGAVVEVESPKTEKSGAVKFPSMPPVPPVEEAPYPTILNEAVCPAATEIGAAAKAAFQSEVRLVFPLAPN